MAQIRTKKQKIAQSIKREQQFSYSGVGQPLLKQSSIILDSNTEDFFGYSVNLIKQDILKTVIIASLIGCILAGIVYFKL